MLWSSRCLSSRWREQVSSPRQRVCDHVETIRPIDAAPRTSAMIVDHWPSRPEAFGALLALAVPNALMFWPKQAIARVAASTAPEGILQVGHDLVCHLAEVGSRSVLPIQAASPRAARPDDPIGGPLIDGGNCKQCPPIAVYRREEPWHEGDGIRRRPEIRAPTPLYGEAKFCLNGVLRPVPCLRRGAQHLVGLSVCVR
jgi:hypothetical protein